jgi:hypothetical protein
VTEVRSSLRRSYSRDESQVAMVSLRHRRSDLLRGEFSSHIYCRIPVVDQEINMIPLSLDENCTEGHQVFIERNSGVRNVAIEVRLMLKK